MSVNGDAVRRDMWAGHRTLLGADTTVKERCALNKVAESSLCKWMARFREGDSGRFPCRSSEASSRIKATRRGIADAVAIVAASGGGVAVNPFTTSDALCRFVGRDCEEMKLLRFDASG